MRKPKVKHYDTWRLEALRSTLLCTMGDLYCFVWDLRQPVVDDQGAVLLGISNSASKSAEILMELERRGH